MEHVSRGTLYLILCPNFYFTFILCVYLWVNCICTQHRSVLLNFCMLLLMMMCMWSMSTPKKNRNINIGVPGTHHFAINILWTMCVVHSKLSQVVILHSYVWEVPISNPGTNFSRWSLLYSCCHSMQIPVLYLLQFLPPPSSSLFTVMHSFDTM
jgi:hypothetical protein